MEHKPWKTLSSPMLTAPAPAITMTPKMAISLLCMLNRFNSFFIPASFRANIKIEPQT